MKIFRTLDKIFENKGLFHIISDSEKKELREAGLEYLTHGGGFWIIEEKKSGKIYKVKMCLGNESSRNLKIVFYLHKILEIIFKDKFLEIEAVRFGKTEIIVQNKVDTTQVGADRKYLDSVLLTDDIRSLFYPIEIKIDTLLDNFFYNGAKLKYLDLVQNNFLKSDFDLQTLITKMVKMSFPADEIEEVRDNGERIIKLTTGEHGNSF
jgi:hypothetical protein